MLCDRSLFFNSVCKYIFPLFCRNSRIIKSVTHSNWCGVRCHLFTFSLLSRVEQHFWLHLGTAQGVCSFPWMVLLWGIKHFSGLFFSCPLNCKSRIIQAISRLESQGWDWLSGGYRCSACHFCKEPLLYQLEQRNYCFSCFTFPFGWFVFKKFDQMLWGMQFASSLAT